MPIEKWKTELAQLMFTFTEQPRTYRSSPELTFTDQFGNFIEFSHLKYLCYAPPLLKLLNNPDMKTIEVEDVDKGYLSYSVYQHTDGYFILFESRVNLNGWCGNFTSFAVVPALETVIAFVEGLENDENE